MADPLIPTKPTTIADEKALRSLTVGSQKAEQAELAAAAKRITHGGVDTQRAYAAAAINGNELAEDPVYQDLRNMSFGGLLDRIGRDAAYGSVNTQAPRMAVYDSLNSDRTGSQVLGDHTLDLGTGLLNSAGGLVGFAGGIVDGGVNLLSGGNIRTTLGSGIAQATQAGSEFLEQQQSEALQSRRETRALFDELNDADSQAQTDRAIANLSEDDWLGRGWEGAKQIGRDTGNAIANVMVDPAMFGSVTAKGIGSLVPSVGAAKLAQWAAKGGTALMQKLAVPLAVGVTESGGAFNETANRVMAMSEADLNAGSDLYREMRAERMDHASAQRAVANATGLMAAGVNLPFATAGGKLAEKFEAGPLSPGSLVGALSNIGKETVEEGLQGLSSSLSSNFATQTLADDTQGMLEGVGRSVGQGMVGGFGMAATLQGPGAAVKGTALAAKGGLNAVSAGLDMIAEPLQRRADAKAEAGSSVSLDRAKEAVEQLSEAASTLQSLVPSVSPVVADPNAVPVPEAPPEPEEQAAQESREAKAVRFEGAIRLGPAEINQAPAIVKQVINDGQDIPLDAPAADRGALMLSVVEEAKNKKYDANQKEEILLWVYENYRKLEALEQEDFSDFGEAGAQIQSQVRANVQTLKSNPQLMAATTAAKSAVIGSVPELTPESLQTPEVQALIRKAGVVAEANPIGFDPKFGAYLLNQTDEGNISLPEAVIQSIRLATDFRNAVDANETLKVGFAEEAIAAGAVAANVRQTTDLVREDLHDGEDKDAANQYSLNRYTAEISGALAQGNMATAQRMLDSLRNFAQHYENKVEALGKSADLKRNSNNKITFRGWTGSGWRKAEAKNAYSAYVNPYSANSVYLARTIAADAAVVRETYNQLLAASQGRLTGDVLAPLALHPVMSSAVQKPGDEATTTTSAVASKQENQDEELVLIEKFEDTSTKGSEPESTGPQIADAQGSQEGTDEAPGSADQAQAKAADRTTGTKAGTGTGGQATGKPGSADGVLSGLDGQPKPKNPEEVTVERNIPDEAEGYADNGEVTEDFSYLRKDTATGRNLFIESVDVDLTKGKLLGEANPLESVLAALTNPEDFAEQSGVGYSVDRVQGQVFRNLLTNHGYHLVNGINALLNYRPVAKTKDGKPGQMIREMLAAGKDKMLQRDGRIFNLLDPRLQSFDPRLVESAAIAAIHWAITSTGSVGVTREDVARSLKINEAQVTNTQLRQLQGGMQETRAAESLARVILEFWGATLKTDVPMNEAQGIAQQLAAEMITLLNGRLVDTTIIDLGTEVLDQDGNLVPAPKTVSVVSTQVYGNPAEEKAVKAMGQVKNFLKDVSTVAKEPEFFFDSKPAKIQQTQKRNFLGRISAKIERALSRHQDIVFVRNAPLLDVMQAIGFDGLRDLEGYEVLEPEQTNASHLEMLRGKNNTIDYALNGVERHDVKLHAYAAEKGKDPNEVNTHFDWYQGRNGRIMAKGFTGQAVKWMREAFTPTVSVLNFLPGSADHDFFWKSVAQSLGIKTERKYGPDAIADAQALVSGPLGDAILELKAWYTEPESNPIRREVLKNALVEAKIAFSPRVLHALMAVARYELAMEKGDEKELSAFKHMLSLEADGVTDGPINAMMHFISGRFTKQQLNNLARGGVFLGSLGRTLNEFYLGGTRKDDVYQTAADDLGEGMREVYKSVRDNMPAWAKKPGVPNALAQMNALRRVLHHFGDFAEDDKGRLVFGRNNMKNPLTISVYGSSVSGIMGKLAAAIADQLYLDMTEVARLRRELGDDRVGLESLSKFENYPELYEDLLILTGRKAVQAKDGTWYSLETLRENEFFGDREDQKARALELMNQTRTKMNNPLTFEFSSRNMAMLQANLVALMGEPMEQAINTIMGDTKATMDLMMAATQVQGHIFRDRFKEAVKKRLAEKRASGELTNLQELTMDDYNAVFAEMSQYAAIVESYDAPIGEEQHVNLSISESIAGEEDSIGFFRSVAGKFRVGATLPQPGNVGVASAPMMTISRGDAQMMVNYFASQDAPDLRVNQVYDGLEMPANGIEEISRRINEASYQAWLNNPMKDVSDSYANFLRRGAAGPLGEVTSFDTLVAVARGLDAQDKTSRRPMRIPGEHMSALRQMISGVSGVKQTSDLTQMSDKDKAMVMASIGDQVKEDLSYAMSLLGTKLAKTALEVEARKRVFARIGLSNDHMASAEAPFVKPGEMPAEGQMLESFLEDLRQEELAKLQADQDAERNAPLIERASTRMRNLARLYGEPLLNGKVHLVEPSDLITMMRDAEMPEEVRALFYSVAPKLGGIKIFIGSKDALNTYYAELMPPNLRGQLPDVGKGLFDPENGWLFISNPSAETVIHEAIHAATAALIFDHSADSSLVEAPARTAIENLYKLMDEFLNMDFRGRARKDADLKAFPDASRDVALLVQNQIRTLMTKNPGALGRAAALNEYLAWSLSNQHLSKLLGKTKTYARLAEITSQVVSWVRAMLGMRPNQKDMLSAVRFNAEVLFRSGSNLNNGVRLSPSAVGEAQAVGLTMNMPVRYLALNHTLGIKDEVALEATARRFNDQLNRALDQMGLNPQQKQAAQYRAMFPARRAATLFGANHFGFTASGKLLFEAMQASFAAGIELDNRALVKAQDVYEVVLSQLTPESFLDDPNTTNQYELDRAERQYRSLTGEYGFERYTGNKNNLLASFLALSQVNPRLREVLEKIELPRNREYAGETLDDRVNAVGRSVMDTLTSVVSKTGFRTKNTVETLDILVESLGSIQKDTETGIEKYSQGLLDAGNAKVTGYMASLGDKAWDFASTGMANNTGVTKKKHKALIYGTASYLGALLNENNGEAKAEQMLSFANRASRLPKEFRNLLGEIIGVTDQNWGVLRMVNQVRSKVQAMRQDYREELPKLLASKFSRTLEKVELTRMFLGLAKTDIAALGQMFSVREMGRMLTDAAYLQTAVVDLEDTIRRNTGADAGTYLQKINELAEYMVNGNLPNHGKFLRNAEAIARLLGEPKQNHNPANDLVRDIDVLVSLKALQLLDTSTTDTLSSLVQTEADGMYFTMLYLGDTRLRESQKNVSLQTKLNAYKGYVPSERQDGASLIVMDESVQVDLIQRGYVRVGDYEGPEEGRKAYYYSTTAGRSTYQQGILQTVQSSYFGVNSHTSYSVSGQTAGVISGQDLVNLLDDFQNGRARINPTETLLPIYDEDGNLIAYERSMTKDKLALLDRNEDLGEMLGAWAGRQAEEELALQYNAVLVKRLKDMWDAAKVAGRTDEFVDLSKRSNDKVVEDARKLIPFEVRDLLKAEFGADGYMVRRDLLDNVLGYRLPSVSDMWSETSNNVPKEAKAAFRKTATVLFGLVGKENDAFKYLVTSEKLWQTAISGAKNIIVVSSVVVPVANLASNFLQLMLNGVSPRDIMKGMLTKLLEIEQYQKHQKLRVDLKGEMARYRKNPDKMRQLNARMKRLDDAERRMSIWPLIEAGEFSTISEGMTQVDAALTSGKWAEWVQAKVEALPTKFGTLGRYAFVTRDTALFQGMSRATSYGDFLARAVLYDHLTKKKSQDKESVLRLINEEFVNYNFLPGRTRSYLESMGLTWFFAFKIRSMKTALRHARNNPIQSMLMGFGGALGVDAPVIDAGLPMNDNMVSAIMSGGLDSMTGPDMFFRAPELNPWYNLFH